MLALYLLYSCDDFDNISQEVNLKHELKEPVFVQLRQFQNILLLYLFNLQEVKLFDFLQ